MKYTIRSQKLTVSADSKGAQLTSIRGVDGVEYLWQGDQTVWSDQAPVLFPYVARLTGGEYCYRGKRYSLPIHGFASRMEFEAHAEFGEMRFTLRDTPETQACYPFPFRFAVSYRLEGSRLFQTFSVRNSGQAPMPFGLGAHPGFRVPLEEGLPFQSYAIAFPEAKAPVRIGFTEECFLSGRDVPYPLEKGELPLAHSLFDSDAVVLRGTGSRAVLFSRSGARYVQVDYPDMPYVGLWHRPKTEAAYVCIEPWLSLPSRQGVVEDLERQPGLYSLPAGETWQTVVSYTFG